ncbi:hypothetical protein DFH28DRAFT_834803, partial [Melampsora americana]
ERKERRIMMLRDQIEGFKGPRPSKKSMKILLRETDYYTILTYYYRFIPFGRHINEFINNDPLVE